MSNEITRENLRARMSSPTPPLIVEALPVASFVSGHLPGAVNLPLDELTEDTLARVLPDADAEIVVYGSSSTYNNSHVAGRKLESLGYRNVSVYRGGKVDWKMAGLSLEVTS